MRSLRFTLVALAIALSPGLASAQSDSVPIVRAASRAAHDAGLRFTLHAPAPIATPAGIAVTADRTQHRTPASDYTRFPFELAAVGLATARKSAKKKGGKKSASRSRSRSSATRSRSSKTVPMYLDSDVHVMRDDKKGNPKTTAIKGGVLVEDTDLTQEEIDDLTARRVIRPAKPEEIERLANAPAAAERAQLVSEQEAEVQQLQATHANALAALGDTASAEDRTALQEEQAQELTDLQAEHVDALNAFDEKQAK